MRVSVKNLPTLVDILRTVFSDKETMVTSAGDVIRVGTHRLKVVEFLSVLLQRNCPCVDEVFLTEGGVFATVAELFFASYWNNFLHAVVGEMVCGFIRTRGEEEVAKMLQRTGLVGRLAKEGEREKDEGSKGTRGYMGFVFDMGRAVEGAVKAGGEEGEVAKFVRGVEGWGEFAAGELRRMERESEVILGGEKPGEGMMGMMGMDGLGGGMELGGGGGGMMMGGEGEGWLVKQNPTAEFPKDFLEEEEDFDDEEEDIPANFVFRRSFDRLPEGDVYSTGESVCIFIF